MQEIKKITILGAGAMGAYFASRFFDAPEFSTTLIARDERYDRLRSKGLVVNGKDSYICSIYGIDKVLYAVSVGIDGLRQGNQITYTKGGTHYFGEAANTEVNPRVRRVQDAFGRAGITYETPTDMIRTMWWKFMINVGMNQASAVMRAPYGVFQSSESSEEAQALMKALMSEVIDLAQASEVDLTKEDITNWYSFLHSLSPTGKTSMLQDIEAGRKTEVEIFGGKVVELGNKYSVPTPANQTVLSIIKVLEEQALGSGGPA